MHALTNPQPRSNVLQVQYAQHLLRDMVKQELASQGGLLPPGWAPDVAQSVLASYEAFEAALPLEGAASVEDASQLQPDMGPEEMQQMIRCVRRGLFGWWCFPNGLQCANCWRVLPRLRMRLSLFKCEWAASLDGQSMLGHGTGHVGLPYATHFLLLLNLVAFGSLALIYVRPLIHLF